MVSGSEQVLSTVCSHSKLCVFREKLLSREVAAPGRDVSVTEGSSVEGEDPPSLSLAREHPPTPGKRKDNCVHACTKRNSIFAQNRWHSLSTLAGDSRELPEALSLEYRLGLCHQTQMSILIVHFPTTLPFAGLCVRRASTTDCSSQS